MSRQEQGGAALETGDRYSEGKQSFGRDGFAVFSTEAPLFEAAEWTALYDLALGDKERFSLVTTGDTSEAASVLVNRILIDGKPLDETAEKLLAIVAGKMGILEEIIGKRGLEVRRAQSHILSAGGFIGLHRDSESSTDYVAAIVLMLQPAANGGDFVVYPSDDQRRPIPPFSVLITDTELPHEVTLVRAGERRSLAFWVAQSSSS